MSDDDEGAMLVLARTDQLDKEHATPDAVKFVADCGHECWMIPSTMNELKSRYPVVKTTCTEEPEVKNSANAGVKARVTKSVLLSFQKQFGFPDLETTLQICRMLAIANGFNDLEVDEEGS